MKTHFFVTFPFDHLEFVNVVMWQRSGPFQVNQTLAIGAESGRFHGHSIGRQELYLLMNNLSYSFVFFTTIFEIN